jgi:hypothetical protein
MFGSQDDNNQQTPTSSQPESVDSSHSAITQETRRVTGEDASATTSTDASSQAERMNEISQVQARYADQLMSKAHVLGVAVGMAQEGGTPTGELALVVLVDSKVPSAQLAEEDVIPQQLDGVRVDVQEVGEIYAQ